jgi:cell division protein FtsB
MPPPLLALLDAHLSEDLVMAKALHGYMSNTDPRVVAQLTAESRRLRQRVSDLEAHVLRLQSENDALAAAARSSLLTLDESMQPV